MDGEIYPMTSKRRNYIVHVNLCRRWGASSYTDAVHNRTCPAADRRPAASDEAGRMRRPRIG